MLGCSRCCPWQRDSGCQATEELEAAWTISRWPGTIRFSDQCPLVVCRRRRWSGRGYKSYWCCGGNYRVNYRSVCGVGGVGVVIGANGVVGAIIGLIIGL